MYGGRVIFVLMAPFNTTNFYADVDQIYDTIGSPQLRAMYTDGRSFSTDLKLLIAQLCAKDWAPMDSKRMELRVYLLRAHLSCAISMGRLDTKSHEMKLVSFDTHEEITDSTLQLGGNLFTVHDTGLKLKPSDGGSIGSILLSLKEIFQEVVQRDGKNDETWHTGFVGFLEGVVNRRKQWVMEWISSNSQTFQQHDDIQRVTLEAAALCAELIQQLSVCSCTCKKCFLRCTKEKGHADGHLCLGDHLCIQFCSYCVREKDADSENISVNKCSDAAGHQGSHDCRVKEHTCDKTCAHYGQAAKCNKKCAGMVGHDGQHLCNSREHKCKEQCSLHSCTNPCITPFEISDHSRHACHEKFCPMSCNVKGCNRRCESKDHFHDDTPGVVHYCGLSHPCLEKCEAHGNCAVQQDLIRTTATFTSKYGSFEYEHVAEQSGVRKSCCKEIPPFQTEHEGPHSHSLKENIVHFCDIKCPACGYFCTEPIGHAGLHNTVHGNMRNTTFFSDSEKIETVDRTYAWGESGAAEMCNMHCKKQGRGHLHLVLCPSGQGGGGICYSRLHADGVRHETQKTGPHFDVPKDEMTHTAYWKHMQFTDPCSQEDQRLFNLCGHECPSEEHEENSVAGTSTGKGESKKSFCTLQLWHGPASEEEKNNFKGGYVTSDGHHMDCSHVLPSNVIFIIDRSLSMCHHDVTPQFAQFQETHNNRLGCVFEAILRFIRTRLYMSLSQGADLASVVLFNHEDSALAVVELEAMDQNIVNKLLVYSPDGGTNFSAGLKQAERILLKSKLDGDERHPIVIFLSDGENLGSDDEALDIIKSMRREHGKHLQIFTVKLGSECWTKLPVKGKNEKILERMADEGKSFTAADRLILSQTFVGIAKSLKPLTRALVVNPKPSSSFLALTSFVMILINIATKRFDLYVCV
ncbi:hypothetical protein R1flu_007214 [Riccia fluitans]|uniref:VWFA domain-containing protein n=1 Tax=Riccia fluitans TaxID=41844 RepID=A0ABD1YY76_9MARC